MDENTQNQNEQPMGEVSSEQEAPGTPMSEDMGGEKKSFGPVLGIVIIVVLLILAGFYFWGQQLSNGGLFGGMDATEIMEQPDPVLEALKTQDASDEIIQIENDLNASALDGLDAELMEIDKELGL